MFIHIIHYLYGLSNIKRDEYLIEDCRQVTRFCDSSLLRLKAYQRGKTSTGGVGLLLFECDVDITV